MGIDVQFKELLRERYPDCFHGTNTQWKAQVILDDLSLNLAKLLPGIRTWDDLPKRLKRRIIECDNFSFEDTRKYVLTIDEGAHVPVCKSVLTAKQRYNEKLLFTPEQLTVIDMGPNQLVPRSAPAPGAEFGDVETAKIIATRSLRSHALAYTVADLEKFMLPVLPPEIKGPAEGFHLVVDGQYADYPKDRAVSVMEAPKQTRRIASLFRQSGAEKPRFQEHPTVKIGESDMKLVWHILCEVHSKSVPKRILVRSSDGDTIPIMLMNVMRMRRLDGSLPDCEIYIDLFSHGKTEEAIKKMKEQRYLDLFALARRIAVDVKLTHHPKANSGIGATMKNPLELFSMFLVLGGNDYVEKFPRISARALWEEFWNKTEHRHQLVVVKEVNPAKEARELLETGRLQNRSFAIDEHFPLHIITQIYLRANQMITRETLKVGNGVHDSPRFLDYEIAEESPGLKRKREETEQLLGDLNLQTPVDELKFLNNPHGSNVPLKCGASHRVCGYDCQIKVARDCLQKRGVECYIPEFPKIQAIIRRAVWYCIYAMNVGASRPFFDPISVNPTGEPIWGWSYHAMEDGSMVLSGTDHVHMG